MSGKFEFLSKLAAEVDDNASKGEGDSKPSDDKSSSGDKKDSKKKPPFFAKKDGDKTGDKENKGGEGESASEDKNEKGENPGGEDKPVGGENQGGGETEIPGKESEESGHTTGTNPIDPTSIIDYLESNPTTDDEAFHEFAESQGFDIHQAEAIAYALAGKYVMFLRGGRASQNNLDPNSVDPEQLQMGMQVESEHSDDPATQKKIAMDHLSEDPQYYTKLQQMESGQDYAAVPNEDPNQNPNQNPNQRPDQRSQEQRNNKPEEQQY